MTVIQLNRCYGRLAALCFLFRSSGVQISARSHAISTAFFHSFSQSLQANAGIVPQSAARMLPSMSLIIHYVTGTV
jgi:hypothetical protein